MCRRVAIVAALCLVNDKEMLSRETFLLIHARIVIATSAIDLIPLLPRPRYRQFLGKVKFRIANQECQPWEAMFVT